MRQLNAYVKGRLRDRWHLRSKGWAPDQPDLVDHLMRSLEVSSCGVFQASHFSLSSVTCCTMLCVTAGNRATSC